MLPSGSIRIVNVKDQLFCCGLGYFDSTNGTCYNSTRGSNAPFPVDQGRVIFNRSSGSTLPNDTSTIISTVTLAASTIRSVTSVVTTAAATTRTAASSPPTSHRETTVGVAVGVPLGIALFAVGGMLWGQKRKADGLMREKKGREEKSMALLESIRETMRREDVPHGLSGSPVRYQLEDATIGELEDAMIGEIAA